MIKTREFYSDSNTNTLCETYSTIGAELLQTETGIVYSSSVIDVIAGYDGDGNPYSRYTYAESGINPDEITPEEIIAELEGIL